MEFQTKADFKWNQSHEAGLPTDKEILAEPANVRAWLVQDAICRTLTEVTSWIEQYEKRQAKKK